MRDSRFIGKKIRIIYMEGEQDYEGREGVVKHCDDIGQLHGTWGGLAVNPKCDVFMICEE